MLAELPDEACWQGCRGWRQVEVVEEDPRDAGGVGVFGVGIPQAVALGPQAVVARKGELSGGAPAAGLLNEELFRGLGDVVGCRLRKLVGQGCPDDPMEGRGPCLGERDDWRSPVGKLDRGSLRADDLLLHDARPIAVNPFVAHTGHPMVIPRHDAVEGVDRGRRVDRGGNECPVERGDVRG